MIAPDDLSAWNLASQARGFTPAKIADANEVSTILRNAEQQRIRDRKRSIVNRFAKAVEMGMTRPARRRWMISGSIMPVRPRSLTPSRQKA